jgi:hypothetical protein
VLDDDLGLLGEVIWRLTKRAIAGRAFLASYSGSSSVAFSIFQKV